jgi:hypothetical protein
MIFSHKKTNRPFLKTTDLLTKRHGSSRSKNSGKSGNRGVEAKKFIEAGEAGDRNE